MNEELIRKLARSSEWQALYARAKDLNISLFKNRTDFSKLQIIFMQFLEMYHNLYVDLYLKEEGISEEVIENDLWADSYLLWKRKKRDEKKLGKKDLGKFTGIPSVTFIKSKKRR